MLSGLKLPSDKISRLLANWPAGGLLSTRAGAGTANPAIVVITSRGEFFLKRRNPRYCDPGQLAYDHSVIAQLARAALPVTPPVKTLQGASWLSEEESIYELYPLVDGEQHRPGDLAEIAAAGELLARFHAATRDLAPAGEKPWPRYFTPSDRLPEIAEARELLAAGGRTGLWPVSGDGRDARPTEAARILDYLEAQARGVIERVPDERYWSLPQVIVHGDYHQGNMKFRDARIVGLFDFDWVSRQPRLVDVADGLIFLGGQRAEALDPGDVYSLTQPFQFRLPQMRAFLQPYLSQHALTQEEWKCLADLLRARWLYSRLEQMQRKIPAADRLRFLLREVTSPLEWLEKNAELLASGAWTEE